MPPKRQAPTSDGGEAKKVKSAASTSAASSNTSEAGDNKQHETKAVQTTVKDFGKGMPHAKFNRLCISVIKYIDRQQDDTVLQNLKMLCMVESDDSDMFGIPMGKMKELTNGIQFVAYLRQCQLFSPGNILYMQYLLHEIEADQHLLDEIATYGESCKNNPLQMLIPSDTSGKNPSAPLTATSLGNASDKLTDKDIRTITQKSGLTRSQLHNLFQELGLKDHEIENAERKADIKDFKLQGGKVLRHWRSTRGKDATKGAILKAMKESDDLKDVMERLLEKWNISSIDIC